MDEEATKRARRLVNFNSPGASLKLTSGGTMYYVVDSNGERISQNKTNAMKAWMSARQFLIDAGKYVSP